MIIKFIRKWVGGLRYSTALLITGVYIICIPKDAISFGAYTTAMISFIISEHAKPADPGV